MSQHPLDYDSTPRPIHWRRWLGYTLVVVVPLVLVFLLKRPATNLYQQWQRQQAIAAVLQLQQACMQYSIPEGTVVLDHSPGTPALLRQSGYAQVTEMGGRRHSHGAVLVPPSLKKFQDGAADFFRLPLSDRADGVVFMHERKTPSGAPVLIVAYIYTGGQPDPRFDSSYQIRIVRMIPGTPLTTPKHADEYADIPVSIGRPTNGVLQVRAGVPDSVDPTHFVIPIRKGDKTIDLHCWLRDDFKIKVRADDGVVEQDSSFTRALVYWSWPDYRYAEKPDWHRGLK